MTNIADRNLINKLQLKIYTFFNNWIQNYQIDKKNGLK